MICRSHDLLKFEQRCGGDARITPHGPFEKEERCSSENQNPIIVSKDVPKRLNIDQVSDIFTQKSVRKLSAKGMNQKNQMISIPNVPAERAFEHSLENEASYYFPIETIMSRRVLMKMMAKNQMSVYLNTNYASKQTCKNLMIEKSISLN